MSQHQNTMACGPNGDLSRPRVPGLTSLSEPTRLQTWTLPALHRPPASLPVLSWRTVSQHQNTMAAKDGSGPRPAAHGSKRCFLNSLETSFKPCFSLRSCTANCLLACVVLQLAVVRHGPEAPVKGAPRRAKTPWQ